jgi:hypothetical protein
VIADFLPRVFEVRVPPADHLPVRLLQSVPASFGCLKDRPKMEPFFTICNDVFGQKVAYARSGNYIGFGVFSFSSVL